MNESAAPTKCDLIKNQRDYTMLIISNIVNRFGDSLDIITFAWIMYQISGSAALSAIMFGMNMLPTVLLQPFLGVLSERFNKKYIVIIVDIIRGLLVAFIALLYFLGSLNPVHLIVTTILISSVEALGMPAAMGLSTAVLDKKYYEVGVSLNYTVTNIAQLLGTALAGVIISQLGPVIAIIIDAATFFISALIKLAIRYKESHVLREKTENSYLTLLKQGMSYAFKSKYLLVFCVIAALVNMLLVPMNSLSVAYIAQYLNDSADILAIFNMACSIGMIGGGLLYTKISKYISHRAQLLTIALVSFIFYLLLAIVGLQIFPLTSGITIITIGFLLIGISASLASSCLGILFMRHIDPAYISRSNAILNAGATAMIPITSFFISFFSAQISLLAIFVIFSVISILMYGILNISKKVKSLN
ncbi:MFS transporter [Culicoidibacter larvae]|uniref:MFS transporter n=1 Tax=Culicoidibacter larvae TaxID=2579976 RepID=A0A5R8QGC9_9FIRM|nr:MFS transporter [Culicoidibacter larvae]TLG77091.1 MFS transporter [Culicoidibacter larvae]